MGVHRTLAEEPGGSLETLEEEEEEEEVVDCLQRRLHHHGYPQRHHSPTGSTDSDVLNNNQVDSGKGNTYAQPHELPVGQGFGRRTRAVVICLCLR